MAFTAIRRLAGGVFLGSILACSSTSSNTGGSPDAGGNSDAEALGDGTLGPDTGASSSGDANSNADSGPRTDATPDAGADGSPGADASCAPGDTSFLSDWKANASTGEWNSVQVVNANRMHPDGTLTWHGYSAVRVEVDPGDDPLNLGEDTERAEALIMQTSANQAIPENVASATEYYATSYLFPANWGGTELSGDANSWSVVLQLHGPDSLSASPAFSLSAAKTTSGGTETYFIGTNVGALASGCCGPEYSFSGNGSIALAQWTDLVFMITYATGPTGHLSAWRRDQGQTSFAQVVDVANVATLQYEGDPSSVGDHYWKQGLYRGGDVSGRVDMFWIGPTTRGTTFTAVECAAFGTNAGP